MAVQPREPLTVMTFNIRYGTAKDGENEWSARRDMLFEVIRDTRPDLIGLQEALDFQIDEILAAVRGYAVVGVGRDDGAGKGEYAAILFRTERFHVAEAARSGSPTRRRCPASKSWGNQHHAHLVVGAVHRSRRPRRSITSTCTSITSRSRRASAARVLLRGGSTRGAFPPIRSSSPATSTSARQPALATLTGGSGAPFVDTFRVLHPDVKDAGTFSNFKFGFHGDGEDRLRLVLPGTEVMSAEIVRFGRNNRYPSDHFPVTARIRLVDR